jgi:hypothetical protein
MFGTIRTKSHKKTMSVGHSTRLSKEPVARTPATDSAGAVKELDAIIAWCEALVLPTPLLKLKKDEAA